MSGPRRPQWTEGIDLPMTVIASAIVFAFLITGVVFTDTIKAAGEQAYSFLAESFGWVWVLGTAGFVAFIVYLGFSNVGRIKLGAPDDKPEYSAFSWIAMMFALGVGIGLIFFGAAEPVMLYADPPPGGPATGTDEAALVAMQYSIFHWGFHVWAFFGVAGLAIAYSTHRKGRSTLITSTLKPLLGRRTQGPVGRSVDTWVVITTLVGNAVTLGLGTLQVVAGFEYVFGIDLASRWFGASLNTWLLIAVVGVLTFGFLMSATAGIDKGIKMLADFNMLLALALLVFFMVLGPLQFILDFTSESVGAYLFNFIPMSFETGAMDKGPWMQNWTVFFWAWGISWSPYVGAFLAQISKGRTIREYVLGVLVAPTVVTILWFGVLGSTALDLQLSGVDIAAVANESAQAAFFEVLNQFPIPMVTSIAVILLAAIFFVSGADAGAIVLGTFSSWGNPEPKKWITLWWGVQIGLVALVLLVIGGLDALQWGALIAAAPFVLVLIAMCFALGVDLHRDGLLSGSTRRDKPNL